MSSHFWWYVARAGGIVAVEARVAPSIWLGLELQPGAVLRPVQFSTRSADGVVQGAWLGAGLAVRFERVQPPARAGAPRQRDIQRLRGLSLSPLDSG